MPIVTTAASMGIHGKVTNVTNTVILDPANCNIAGECTVFVTFDLPSNAYFAEAEATFLVP